MIPFNKPYLSGKETEYIIEAVQSGKISGDGNFTKKCHHFFEQNFGFKKCLLTTSCTDALEMAALLIDIQPGDEVIMPSYTFVSTANPFVLRGAKIVFCDSRSDNPNIDEGKIEELINSSTKAVVVVHYAGIACNMKVITEIARRHKLFLIEDAAQAIDSYFNGEPLGSFGDLAAFSFHETKNIQCGEGGMLVINDERLIPRAEIIREKGTNRSAFFRGEIDKYNWVDIGSSFLPSDIIAAFLYAQLENLEEIQKRRKEIWDRYFEGLQSLAKDGLIQLPVIPEYASNNAHMFYIVCKSPQDRDGVISALAKENVLAVFHYLSLHKSPYYQGTYDGGDLQYSDYYSDHLVRLPLYFELKEAEQDHIINNIKNYFIRSSSKEIINAV